MQNEIHKMNFRIIKTTPCFTATSLRCCPIIIVHIPTHTSPHDEHPSIQLSTKFGILNKWTLLSFPDPDVCIFCVFAGSPPATGSGTLVIHLEDYNDNAPYVVPSVARVCEDAHDMNVAIVGGRDKDLTPNAAPFKIELGKQPGLDKTWKVTRVNCEYFMLKEICMFLNLSTCFTNQQTKDHLFSNRYLNRHELPSDSTKHICAAFWLWRGCQSWTRSF